MNSCCISGNLTKDPEVRKTTSKLSVCSFDLAVKRPHVKDKTDFLKCTVWNQGADYLGQYGHKGDMVLVTGMVVTNVFDGNDGKKVYQTLVQCESVELRQKAQKAENVPQEAQKPAEDDLPVLDIESDDLPF